MLFDVTECKLSVISETKVEYKDPYHKKPIPARIKEDHLARRTIERFNRLITNHDDVCQREDYQVLGELLYNLIFVDKIRETFEGVYEGFSGKKMKKSDERLRLILEFHKEAKELSSYPWEFIFMPLQPKGSFLAGEISELILTRFVPEVDEITGLQAVKEPLRIWIVYSHPKKLPSLEGAEDVIRDIQTLQSDKIHIELLENRTHKELSERLSKKTPKDDDRPHIFHFIGHGQPGHLAFYKGEEKIKEEAAIQNKNENDIEDYVWVDSGACCTLFDDHKPRLVFLQACSGGETELKSFTNLAQDLIVKEIPAVIAMQYEINIGDASLFTTTVYGEISQGKPIGEAVKEGRRQLGRSVAGGEKTDSWSDRRFATPIVYLQAEDTNIVIEPEPDRQERCPYPDCDALVTTTWKYCVKCRRPLEICRNCGKVMASELRFCGCGFKLSDVSVDRSESEPVKAQKLAEPSDGLGTPRQSQNIYK